MPALTSSNTTVLVTGSNGFIAMWIIDSLLKRGYTVRASVRTEARGKYILETFKSYGDRIQLFPTGDISADGAFDNAVKGVEAIIHTAAVVTVDLDALEPREVCDTAVQGNIGILTSALKYSTSLKRVVITSSYAAISGFSTTPITLSEALWSDRMVEQCEIKGKGASGLAKYRASKTLAEKAVWEWYENHKSQINWDATALNPPWVFGPVLHDVPSIDNLNSSNLYWHNAIVNNEFTGPSPLDSPYHGWVDARDVAEAHVRSLEVPAAGSERIIICAGQFVWQDAVDAVNSLTSSPWPSHAAPFAQGEAGEKVHNITWITSKEKKIFGMKFKTMEEMAGDILADYEKHGWS